MKTYTFGGGCFWCIDAVFRRLKGVTSVESGYAGGETDSPSYGEVSTGTTGHAEVVQVTFNEMVIPREIILDLFFLIHDPTTLNRQGADVGTQYRSIMLYEDASQKEELENALTRAQKNWDSRIVTEIKPLEKFFEAEDEHQDYFNKNPEAGYCQIIIAPKVTKAKAAYTKWFKEEE